MASWVAEHVGPRTLVLALNGAQGTGKSTLARLLKRLLEQVHGLRVAILSLDDLYLTAQERRRRAETIHPLLATRGVPGTHDVRLGIRTIRALREGKPVLSRLLSALESSESAHARRFLMYLRGKADNNETFLDDYLKNKKTEIAPCYAALARSYAQAGEPGRNPVK